VKRWGFILLGTVAMAAPAAPAGKPRDPARAVAAAAPGTFLGTPDEKRLESLRNQPVREVKLNRGGSSISFRITFADGSRAAFKPLQTNVQTVPRKEVAAYRLNRLLGLDHVPPAATRSLHRDDLFPHLHPDSLPFLKRIETETIFDDEGFTRGEISYWIPVIVDTGLDRAESIEEWTRWLTVGQEIPPAKLGMMAQLSSLLVFDVLDNNSDRFSGGNLMGSSDGQTLFYMDNTFGFQIEPQAHERCRQMLSHSQKFSARLVEALRRLDAASIRHAFDPDPIELTAAEIDSVLARKDVVLRYVDGLVARFGAARVLVFP
jgi:hypothetical protein